MKEFVGTEKKLGIYHELLNSLAGEAKAVLGATASDTEVNDWVRKHPIMQMHSLDQYDKSSAARRVVLDHPADGPIEFLSSLFTLASQDPGEVERRFMGRPNMNGVSDGLVSEKQRIEVGKAWTSAYSILLGIQSMEGINKFVEATPELNAKIGFFHEGRDPLS